MLLRVLKAEQLKLRHSPIWIAFFIIPCISAVMGTFNYLNNLDVLAKEWYSLWTQHTIFYCYFFFPALIGVYCAYICRLEHMNNNWNSVLTAPISIGSIYFSKFITVLKMVVLTQVFVGMLFIISGKLAGLEAPVPRELLLWLFFGLCASSAIVAIQLALSLMIRSFAVPVAISLLGGIFGLAAKAEGFGLYFPYSLFSVGMCASDPAGGIGYSVILFMVSCTAFVIIFSSLGILKMKR